MKTTKKDFEIFKKEVEYYQKLLGLLDWDIICKHKNLDEEGFDCGMSEKMLDNKSAIIYLDTDWNMDEVTKENIKLTAKHELLEVFLSELYILALFSYSTREARKALHTIVHVLQKLL